jgi:long-chain acyl-CoA synthetase
MDRNFTTLPGLFTYTTGTYHLEKALMYPEGESWRTYSTESFRNQVVWLALGMHDMGVKTGDSVGILAPSSPEWIIIDLATVSLGAVSVPLFKKISIESLSHEISDSAMKYIFIGNLEELPNIKATHKHLKEQITFGKGFPNDHFNALLRRGQELEKSHPDLYGELASKVGEDDLATIIYTSGSTGLPKGVELTHRNIVSQVHAAAERFENFPEDIILSALPLAHIFERMVMYYYISSGLPVYFADDPKLLGTYAKSVRPTMMTVVPRIMEKVYLKMQEGVMEKTGIAGAIARAGFRRAERRSPGTARKGLMGPVFDKLLYAKFRAALGGRLRMSISGSAKLSPEIASFFVNCGIEVYEGYGLTEASPVIAVNYPGNRRIGTVGPAFPGVSIKLSEDGEVLARGPNIMTGYHNRPDATAEVIDGDGWLHTGDLGSYEDGYLTITGRKKELFKKSTGEYVPPVPLENELVKMPGIETAVVVADNRTFVTALIFPEYEKLGQLKKQANMEEVADDEFLDSHYFRSRIEDHITEMNKHHHHCEHIADFRVIHRQASVEDGELTPTMKVRRFFIEKKYHDVIEDMYKVQRGWK